jgi:hypothetical protein
MGRPIQVIEIVEDDYGIRIVIYDGEGYTDAQRRLMDNIVKQFPKDARVEFVDKAAIVHEMEDK